MAQPTIFKDADFRKQIKSAPALGYLLFGEEDYLKDVAVREARLAFGGDGTFACFNEIILDAQDFTPERLRSALMPLPMMAERKLILLRGLDFNAMRQTDLDGLCELLAELPEYDYNTLLISVAAGAIDQGFLPKKPSRLLCRLGELVTLVQFERCTSAKLNGWCLRHFQHNGVEATPELAAALIDRCGRDMLTLASEIDKISYYVLSHGKAQACRNDIDTVACTTSEYDAFAFSSALMERNAPRALAILADLKFRRVEPLFILGEAAKTGCEMLSVYLMARDGKTNAEISKAMNLHEYKVSLYRRHALNAGEKAVRRMMTETMTADRALKLSPKGYEALETLICSL